MRLRWRTGLALSGACLALAPAAAQAAPSTATVGVDSGGFRALTVSTQLGDPASHDMAVNFAYGSYSVTDNEGVNPGPGCTAVDAQTASCPEGGAEFITLNGGA